MRDETFEKEAYEEREGAQLMQSMDADGPRQVHAKAAYQGYEGNQGYSRQSQGQYDPFGQTGQAPQGAVDDDFADAVAARIAQQFNQGPSGKIYSKSRSDVSASQRVAVVIVSVVMLVPLAAITLGISISQGFGFFGFLAFIAACGAIVLINIAFSLTARR